MQAKGLAPKTQKIFEKISRLECIRPYILVGGTALSLQLGTRQSEDLDFMSWKKSANDKCEVEWNVISKELSTIGEVQHVNLMGFDHVEFIVDGVKVSFYACDKKTPVEGPVTCLNNIRLADITSIGVMKMEVMLRRATFRDYYDIYSILREGVDINLLIDRALIYSRHRLKTKNILAILTDSLKFSRDANFEQLSPKYSVTAKEIEAFIQEALR